MKKEVNLSWKEMDMSGEREIERVRERESESERALNIGR